MTDANEWGQLRAVYARACADFSLWDWIAAEGYARDVQPDPCDAVRAYCIGLQLGRRCRAR